MRYEYKPRHIHCFLNWINKLLSEENQVPEHCLKLERWQGPPNMKQNETVLSFKVSLFIQFIQSWKQRQFVYLVLLGIKSQSMKIFVLQLAFLPQNFVVHF